MPEQVVFIVDDDKMSRDSISALVETLGVPAAPFDSGEAFLKSFDPSQSGCIVTDVRMTGMDGIELQESLIEKGYQIPMVVVTGFASTPITVRAMQNGAITLLEKPYSQSELLDAVSAALKLDVVQRGQRAQVDEMQKRYDELNDDERTVLQGIIDGKANKVIAKELDVSIRTVESRRHNVFKKTQTESVAELVRFVMKLRGDQESKS